jgi:hypothetical protein
MNISLNTSVAQGPVTKQTVSARAEPYRPVPEHQPDGTDVQKKGPMDRLAAATNRAQRRVKGVIDQDSLTTRQSMALDKVQRRFDRMTERLKGAVEDGGAGRAEFYEGLDIVYGKLRESLDAILSASDRPAVSKDRHPEQITGLTINRLG